MFQNGSVQGLLDHGCAICTSDALSLPETQTSRRRGGLSYEIQVQVLIVA